MISSYTNCIYAYEFIVLPFNDILFSYGIFNSINIQHIFTKSIITLLNFHFKERLSMQDNSRGKRFRCQIVNQCCVPETPLLEGENLTLQVVFWASYKHCGMCPPTPPHPTQIQQIYKCWKKKNILLQTVKSVNYIRRCDEYQIFLQT